MSKSKAKVSKLHGCLLLPHARRVGRAVGPCTAATVRHRRNHYKDEHGSTKGKQAKAGLLLQAGASPNKGQFL